METSEFKEKKKKKKKLNDKQMIGIVATNFLLIK